MVNIDNNDWTAKLSDLGMRSHAHVISPMTKERPASDGFGFAECVYAGSFAWRPPVC